MFPPKKPKKKKAPFQPAAKPKPAVGGMKIGMK